MVEFSHVYKTYQGRHHALKNVSLRIEKGEFAFLTGPSGAGKTTLFKMLSAFDQPSSGTVQVAGFDVGHLSAKQVPLFRRRIGVIFQDFKLLPNYTVFENVALPLVIRGERQSLIERKVLEILDLVGLIHKQDQLPGYSSGGEQQRTAIARALIHQPGLIVADEPTGNLDPQLTEDIMDLLEKASAQGTTVFIATHDHDLVRRRAKKCFTIQDGVLQESA